MISGHTKRLDSWKEIAEYLGRDLRTVQRWEGEKGLPIHRVPGGKRQAVFAFQDEIDTWLVSQSEPSVPEPEPQPPVPDAAPPIAVRRPIARWWIAAGMGALLIAASWLWLRPTPAMPKVVDYIQISDDNQVGSDIAADRSRVYFPGNDGGIREVSTAGSRAVSIPLPVRDMHLGGICAPHSELLLTSRGDEEDQPLWIFPLPGGPARRIGSLTGGSPTCSSDGATIIYVRGHKLYLTDREGRNSRELVTLPSRPVAPRWSPDGRVLRFSLEDAGTSRLVQWEVSANGSGLHPLFPGWQGCSGNQYHGTWTPDGRYYVFDCAETSSNLWVRSEEGGFLSRISPSPVRLTFSPISLYNPVFSADGKNFLSLGGTLRAEIVRYLPGSGEPDPNPPGVAGDMLDFSRKGDLLTYVGYPYQELWRSRTDGTDKSRLAPGRVIYPRWSPDGRFIAYCALKGKRWKIHLIPAAGGAPEELIPGDTNQSHPSWSPDGDTLAFAGAPWEEAFVPAATAVHLFHRTTREVETLPGSEGLWSPRWSPDGRYLAAITIDSRKVLAYDFAARKWMDSARLDVDYTAWSHDGSYLYVSTVPAPDGSFGVFRIAPGNGRPERILTVRGERLTGTLGHWFGLAPDDSLLFLRDRSFNAIYALDWRAP